MRKAEITRKTAETAITCSLCLDGSGRNTIATGVGFLDHMLTLFAVHSRFDLDIACQGDTWVDDHHSVEDIGIVIGTCLTEALGNKAGICRYGSMWLPMDEALVLCALDLSGRCSLTMDVRFETEKIGTFDTQLIKEFFLGLTRACPMSLHFHELAGENSHHVAEAMFKGFGRALAQAASIDERLNGAVPSSKGVLA
ncbi:MAG: imidazoleglycerol-phosphate dehydratase HisB [Clostridia bacterium]|nr:imidazoleglycerol-phosphate dehydratase HisB [Clostridia bacterium]